MQIGDTLLMVAGPRGKVCPLLGDLRLQLGTKFNLRDERALKFLWVVDFPLFDYSEEEKRLVSAHHPFTAPDPEDLGLLESRPLERAHWPMTWYSMGRRWGEARFVFITRNCN